MHRITRVALSALGAGAAAAAIVGAAPAGAEPNAGSDPAWVVTTYLDYRLNQSPLVPDYPYVCAAGSEWSPAGMTVPGGPPLALQPDAVLDIRTYDPSSVQVFESRDRRYHVVTVDVAGYERAETRYFLLGPSAEGFCIGEIN
ncbi:hypothetical protein [Antrihabitans sp. YC2-6]|uniref:hypothetical protein n=1 Tax=Antrihabitans sp. YC2-6 TaxID=2799498 RepID=UPI0018F3953F|nr:hypothetical protein [Antrihabitans sp. YC2-6]MBJ8348406.1 hypothetical protein [Antrihabitans sp. YC2-6]